MGQRLFGGPRYLFHYFIVSSIVATFAALVFGAKFPWVIRLQAFSPASTSVLWRWTPPHSPHKKEQVASSCFQWKYPANLSFLVFVLCSLLKVLWVLYTFWGYHPNLLHQNAPEPSRTHTLRNSRSCPGPPQAEQKGSDKATVQGPRSMRMALLGQLEKTTNRVDLSKCSDLRIILHPNWQTTTLEVTIPCRDCTCGQDFSHFPWGFHINPRVLWNDLSPSLDPPNNRRRCWEWPRCHPWQW